MKVIIIFALFSSGLVLAEDHRSGTKVGISTEGVFSEPYKRASISLEMKNWVVTPGYITSEDRRFAFVTAGYRFERKLEHGGELFVEPHAGFAQGLALDHAGIFGGRFELETHKWIVASWVDTHQGKVDFTTCEPLAEASHHIGRGFFLGATSSCYLGIGNEPLEEGVGHHEATDQHPASERLIFVGPTASFRKGKVLVGASYEVGKNNERYLAGYISIRWR